MKAFGETQSAIIENLKEIKSTLTQKADTEELLIKKERIKKLGHTLHPVELSIFYSPNFTNF